MGIRHRRSATKHRIPRSVSAQVLRDAERFVSIPTVGVDRPQEPRHLTIGFDARGREIEVIAIRVERGGWVIIHAMPARDKSKELFSDE